MKKISELSVLIGIIILSLGIAGCGGGGGGGGGRSESGDTTPPQISSTTPTHGSAGLATNSSVMVSFNEDMDSETISPSTFYLKEVGSGASVPATVAYADESRTAVLRPQSPLFVDTSYIAIVESAVTDLAGNYLAGNNPDSSYDWSFTVGTAADTTAPAVVGSGGGGGAQTFPVANSTDVALNDALVVTVNEPIDPATVNEQNFIVRKSDDNTPVEGTVTNVGPNIIFEPAANLDQNTGYTATLTEGIKDLAGNQASDPFSWSFATSNSVDLQAPNVASVSPANGQKDVPLSSAIVITFDEPVIPFEFGLIDDRPVSVASDSSFRVMTLTPTEPLIAGRTYTASVRVNDTAGNLMDNSFVWEFSTVNP